MRVFVTGATGFIGKAIVQDLHQAGHGVLGLARSDAAAAALEAMGAKAHRGQLADTASLAAGARACEGVIHAAFIHDFAQYEANAETDRLALAAISAAMEGSGKPLVATSGTVVLAAGRVGTETEAPAPEGLGRIRAVSELVLAAADRGVRVSVVRLPPSVHDRGDHGFVPALIDIARRTGVAAYIGNGANRWPAVHRLDAARLFRLALERALAGTRLHGAAEAGIPMREVAQAIGQGLDLPVRGLDGPEAAAQFGWLAGFVALDNPTASTLTRGRLGWDPQQPGLLADLRDGGYFDPAQRSTLAT